MDACRADGGRHVIPVIQTEACNLGRQIYLPWTTRMHNAILCSQAGLTSESVKIIFFFLPHFLNFLSRIVHRPLVTLQIHPLEPPTLNIPTSKMLVMETGWFEAQCGQGVRLQTGLSSADLWFYLFNVQGTVDSRGSNSSNSSTFKEHPRMSSKQGKLVCGWFITDDTCEYVPPSILQFIDNIASPKTPCGIALPKTRPFFVGV